MGHRVILVCAACFGLLLTGKAWAKGEKVSPETKAFEQALKQALPAAKPSSDGVAGGKLGTSSMRQANRVAAEILQKRMQRHRSRDLQLIRQAGQAEVIVVRGSYDRVQDVLRALQIRHVVVPPRLVAKLPLMSTQTLMINCPGSLSRAAVKSVRRFVKTGGYLVTTDWALTLLARAFPGYVSRGGRNTHNDVVKVHVHDLDDPWLKQIRTMKEKPRWWLEGSSYPIRVLDRQRVKVLISSKEMRTKYGHGPIAVSFRYDDGKVLHMTSHFYLQQARLRSKQEKAKGSTFAAAAGLKGKDLDDLRGKGLDRVKAGELNSAYSMQQLTANVLVSRQADNKKLLGRYNKRARRKLQLGGAKRSVGKDYRLRVLEDKGKKVRVRDLFGNEGWVDRADLL